MMQIVTSLNKSKLIVLTNPSSILSNQNLRNSIQTIKNANLEPILHYNNVNEI